MNISLTNWSQENYRLNENKIQKGFIWVSRRWREFALTEVSLSDIPLYNIKF